MSISNTPSPFNEQLQLYRDVFARELIHEFKFVDDVISGRSIARTDLTDKIIHILTLTVSSAVGLGSGASPIVQGAVTTAALKGEEFFRQKRKEQGLSQLSQMFDAVGKQRLQILAKKVAKEAAKRYENSICKLKGNKEVAAFVRIGVRRIFEYLGREEKPLELEHFLTGLIEGRSGRGIDAVRNTHLKCKEGQKFTAEGAYARGAFFTSEEKVWTPPQIKNRKHGYAKLLKNGLPKYFTRVPETVVHEYWDNSPVASDIPHPVFVRRICTVQDVENYICSEKKGNFNEYLKEVYPGTEIGVFSGDLSHLDLSGKDFSRSDLSGSVISGSLEGTNFQGADLSNVKFEKIFSAKGARFDQADLTEASLQGNFQQAKFNQADLSFAYCEGNFTSIQYVGTIWAGADIEKMEIESIEHLLNIQKKQLENQFDQQQKLASHLAEQQKKLEDLQSKVDNNPAFIQFVENLKSRMHDDEVMIHECEKKLSSLKEFTPEKYAQLKKDLKNNYDFLLDKIEKVRVAKECEEELNALEQAEQSFKDMDRDLLFVQRLRSENIPLKELEHLSLENILKIEAAENFGNSFLYNNLANAMRAQGKSKIFHHGKEITPRSFLEKAVQLEELKNVYVYNNLACLLLPEERSIVNSKKNTEATKMNLLYTALHLAPEQSAIYNNLGATVSEDDCIPIKGDVKMTKKELFLEAIRLDPKNDVAYTNLASILPDAGKIILPEDILVTREQLFLKAISLNPNNSIAYSSLGVILRQGRSVNFPNSALSNSTTYGNDWASHIGVTLSQGGSIRFPNGSVMTQQQLFLKAVQLDPKNSVAYRGLGILLSILPEKERNIELPDGSMMTQQQLFLKAIELNPSDAAAYFWLGLIICSTENIKFPDGRIMGRQELFFQTLRLDPKNSLAYTILGNIARRAIQIPDGKMMTEQELHLQAIYLDPKNSRAWNNLAATLTKNEKIRLHDGRRMTQQELYLEAIDLDPGIAIFYQNLATTLSTGSSIKLFNSTIMTKTDLLLKGYNLKQQNNSNMCIVNFGPIFPQGKLTQFLDP